MYAFYMHQWVMFFFKYLQKICVFCIKLEERKGPSQIQGLGSTVTYATRASMGQKESKNLC
jgi:hypothetical protein